MSTLEVAAKEIQQAQDQLKIAIKNFNDKSIFWRARGFEVSRCTKGSDYIFFADKVSLPKQEVRIK